MNRYTAQGRWKQLKGKMQVQWGKLTGDYLQVITGRCTQIAGERQYAYGVILSKTLRGKKAGRYLEHNSSPSPAIISDLPPLESGATVHTHDSH